MITKIINKINSIGISVNTDMDEIHYISFTNVLIVINGLAIFFYIPYLMIYLPDSKKFLIAASLQFVFYIAALMCNYMKWNFISRNVLAFTALIFTSYEAFITEFYCDIHFFLLIGVMFVFFVFPERERRYSYFIAFCFTFAYIAIELHLSYNSPHPLPPVFIMNLKYVVRFSLFVLIFLFTYYSYTTINRFHREIKSEHMRIETEINLARKIQQQLIPSKNPDKNIYSLYKPMNQVGGDFYDFISFTDSDRIGIFLSDVSGHGVPAAFITTMIKTAIFQSGDIKEDPAGLLFFINNMLVHHGGGNFVTAFYGIYNRSDRKLLFANAGHNYPYIIDSSGVNEVIGRKSKPLGIMSNEVLVESNKTYWNTEICLQPNSKFLLYTDGLVETRSKKNNKLFFEDAGMYRLFKDSCDLRCNDFISKIYSTLVQYIQHFGQSQCLTEVKILKMTYV